MKTERSIVIKLICAFWLLSFCSRFKADAQAQSLNSLVSNARLIGQASVSTGWPRINHRMATSIEDELAESLVILARVDASRSHLVEGEPYVFTTYNLHVLEVLSANDSLSSFAAPDAAHLLQPYEVDLTEIGGTTKYKGVEVTTPLTEGKLADGQTYLFFLNRDIGCSRCYHRMLGVAGASHLDASLHFDANGKDVLSTELHKRFADDYQNLKKSLHISPR